MKFVGTSQYRSDGRYINELREIKIEKLNTESITTVLYDQGATSLHVVLDGPKDRQKLKNRINVKIKFLEISRYEKGLSRDATAELEKSLSLIFEDLVLLPDNSAVEINVLVKNDDGSVYVCAVNAIAIAICCAAIPLLDIPIAVSVAYIENRIILDLLADEENCGGVVFDFVLLRNKKSLLVMKMNGRFEINGIDAISRSAEIAVFLIYEKIGVFLMNLT